LNIFPALPRLSLQFFERFFDGIWGNPSEFILYSEGEFGEVELFDEFGVLLVPGHSGLCPGSKNP
jgi:hypothetical protein